MAEQADPEAQIIDALCICLWGHWNPDSLDYLDNRQAYTAARNLVDERAVEAIRAWLVARPRV